jgi:hypothetical protein
MKINKSRFFKQSDKWGNLIDTVIKIFEVISLILIAAPYCSIVLWMFLSSIPGYFFLFPYGLLAILPTGIFGLLIQFLRRLRKLPTSKFSNFVFNNSVVTTVFGVLAFGLVYVVAS